MPVDNEVLIFGVLLLLSLVVNDIFSEDSSVAHVDFLSFTGSIISYSTSLDVCMILRINYQRFSGGYDEIYSKFQFVAFEKKWVADVFLD